MKTGAEVIKHEKIDIGNLLLAISDFKEQFEEAKLESNPLLFGQTELQAEISGFLRQLEHAFNLLQFRVNVINRYGEEIGKNIQTEEEVANYHEKLCSAQDVLELIHTSLESLKIATEVFNAKLSSSEHALNLDAFSDILALVENQFAYTSTQDNKESDNENEGVTLYVVEDLSIEPRNLITERQKSKEESIPCFMALNIGGKLFGISKTPSENAQKIIDMYQNDSSSQGDNHVSQSQKIPETQSFDSFEDFQGGNYFKELNDTQRDGYTQENYSAKITILKFANINEVTEFLEKLEKAGLVHKGATSEIKQKLSESSNVSVNRSSFFNSTDVDNTDNISIQEDEIENPFEVTEDDDVELLRRRL